jgi:hypothetical protein
LTKEELRFMAPLVSESLFARLGQRIGWNVVITATK